MTDVDALIVDLDGVIRHWNLDDFEALATSSGVSRADLGAIAFERALIADAMTGVLTAEAWAQEIGRRAAETHGCDADTIAGGFAALGWTVDQHAVALLRDVRGAGEAKLALFSNASTKLEADLASCALDVE